jgi:hypothetical protein
MLHDSLLLGFKNLNFGGVNTRLKTKNSLRNINLNEKLLLHSFNFSEIPSSTNYPLLKNQHLLDLLKFDSFDNKAVNYFWVWGGRNSPLSVLPLEAENLNSRAVPIGSKIDLTALNLKHLGSSKSRIRNLNPLNRIKPDNLTYPTYFNTLVHSENSKLRNSVYVSKIFNLIPVENAKHSPYPSNKFLSSSHKHASKQTVGDAPEYLDILNHLQDIALDSGFSHEGWDSL